LNCMVRSIEEGLSERKVDKEQERERDAANEEIAKDSVVATADEETSEGGEKKKGTGLRSRKNTPKK